MNAAKAFDQPFSALLVAIGLAAAGWFIGHGFLEARAADRYVTVNGLSQR